MELKEYLPKHLAAKTIERYTRELEHFFISNVRKKIEPKTATYNQILAYIGERRKHYKNSGSLGCTLHAIKHYYSYLVEVNEREDNPAKSIILRDKQSRDIQTQDLFTPQELELLLNRKERYKVLKNRNLVIISLLIYQGLRNAEIKNLELKDIDL